jgi:poly(3-hydroxybutyrate) depolymerase
MKVLFIFFAAFSQTVLAQAGWQRTPTAGLESWIYTPAAKATGARSLVVTLHGCTQHAQDFKERGNWEAAAEKNNIVVAIPDVPNGGVVLGCWDYYGRDHTVSNRHNGALIEFTEALVAQKDLKIDPRRVSVAGLSSGAGQAMLLGCLRPDLYSGVGLVGSPAIGTGQYDISRPAIGSQAVEELCTSLASGRSFAEQRTSVVHADQDFIVNPQHSELITEALAHLYGVKDAEPFDVSRLEGMGNPGEGMLYRDASGKPRLSVIRATGLGHAWPAGSGFGFAMKYINPNSFNYPAYLAGFLAEQREEKGRR